MVITGLTRNQFVRKHTRVRIPLSPPRMNNPNTIIFVKADYWGVWVTNRIR